MEDYLGLIGGKNSRVRPIILRQNGIKERYYALDKQQNITHTNAELASNSIKLLFDSEEDLNTIELLACATTSPDQYLPSHASMVHGLLKNRPMEIYSSSGICMCGFQAFKIAYMSVALGNSQNAVCSTSELPSPGLLSKYYDIEYEYLTDIEAHPSIAFEKDFLRFMLSDGASSLLLENTHSATSQALKVEWIEMISYANEKPTCMYMWAERTENGELRSWKDFSIDQMGKRSVWALKQDIKLLNKYLIEYWVNAIEESLSKHNQSASEINYIIPHSSSKVIYDALLKEIAARNIDLNEKKWFTNLETIGNVASAAIFAGLDEFWKRKTLFSGDKILLLVPESGRFSYGIALLTVV